MVEKIYIGINDKRIELKGKELEDFLSERAKKQKKQEEFERLIEAEQLKKEASKESAMAKLKKLGLTDDEIESLLP